MTDFSSLEIGGLLAAGIQLIIVIGVFLRVVLTRHPPGSAFAWILFTAILPYVGFAVYLLLGERPIGRLRAIRYRRLLAHWYSITSRNKLTPTGPLPATLAPHRTLIHLAVNIAQLPVTSGSRLQLLSDSDETFAALLSDIGAAKHSIDMEFYIWHTGGRIEQVADALVAARARGVRIRLLVDAFGSAAFLKSSMAERFEDCGIRVASAMPLNFLRFFGLQRVDLRLHRKTVVIDRRVAYTGSLNMVDPDCYAEAKTIGAWIDAMVRTEGPAVRELEAIFLTDWALQPDGDPSDMDILPLHELYEQPGNATTVVVPSGPLHGYNPGQNLLLESINAARFSLCITTPYFIPSEALAAALEVASRRGVKVTLIIPERADSRTVTYAGRRYFDDLLTAGIRILLYRGGLLHTKSLAVDDSFAVFGTVNFDNRSIQLDFEVSMLIFDEKFMADIKKLHEQYAAQSREIDPAGWRKRPVSDRLKEGASYLLSPLL